MAYKGEMGTPLMLLRSMALLYLYRCHSYLPIHSPLALTSTKLYYFVTDTCGKNLPRLVA